MDLLDPNNAARGSEFEQNIDLLRQISFFSAFPLDAIKVVAYLCTRERYRPEEYLFQPNEDDGQAFYVLAGTLALTCPEAPDAGQVRRFGPGTFIGGMALLGRLQRLFALQAVADTTCLVLTRTKFTSAMAQFPDLMPRIAGWLVEAVANWERRLITEQRDHGDLFRQLVGVTLI